VARPSLSSFQSVVGLVAGITSICGALYSAVEHWQPIPRLGDVVAVVRDGHTERPLPGATVEVLTPEDALVTTLTPAGDGRAETRLREGTYRLRAIHPQRGEETRDVEVLPGQTAEVRFQLAREDAAPVRRGARTGSPSRRTLGDAVERGVSAAHGLLRRLGL